MDGGLDDVGVDAADRAVQHDRAERLDLRHEPLDVVGAPDGHRVVVLQHESAHPVVPRDLGQVGVVERTLEERRMRVGVHVDRAPEQVAVRPCDHPQPLLVRA